MNISVVIPVYNSAQSLRPLLERLVPVLQKEGDKFEIIFVNDGSSDGSQTVLEQLPDEFENIRFITFMRNFGQHNALLCGIRAAQYEILVTMDDDLQHPPEELPKLLQEIQAGNDVVYGKPAKQQHGVCRDLASSITKFTLKQAMGVEAAGNVSAFRAFRTELRQAFADYNSPFVCIDVLLTWGTRHFIAVSVRHEERTLGVSNYNFYKLITHAVNMLTGFSTIPLQLASLLGFTFSLFGIMVLLYVTIGYLLNGTPVQGFPFIASTIAIFSGVQLFSLGIIGEYLARMHFRLSNKPAYVISSSEKEK